MDQPLDYFDEFEENVQIIALRYFHFPTEAQLYAAHLRDAGIRCFVSNVNSVTMLPVEQPGIGLHIRAEDHDLARQVIQRVDRQLREEPHENYHDADHEDIDYLRSLGADAPGSRGLLWAVALIVGLLILRALARAAGWAPALWDWF